MKKVRVGLVGCGFVIKQAGVGATDEAVTTVGDAYSKLHERKIGPRHENETCTRVSICIGIYEEGNGTVAIA